MSTIPNVTRLSAICFALLALVAAAPAAAVPIEIDLVFTPSVGSAPSGSITYESGDAVASGSAALTAFSIFDPNTGSTLTEADDLVAANVNFDGSANAESVTILADDNETGATFDLDSSFNYSISGEFGGGSGSYAFVPEPGALLLLASGVGLLALRRRRG